MTIFGRVARTWALARLYWGTDDYDWSTIVVLMRFEITRIKEHVREHRFYVGWEKDVAAMNRAEVLLDRLLDDAREETAKELGTHLGDNLLRWWC